MSLLRQDVRLPESSVHDFARDLVTALQYLHSKEIIYCDVSAAKQFAVDVVQPFVMHGPSGDTGFSSRVGTFLSQARHHAPVLT